MKIVDIRADGKHPIIVFEDNSEKILSSFCSEGSDTRRFVERVLCRFMTQDELVNGFDTKNLIGLEYSPE
jgi:ATP-dependent 26S proteasome regulatory subunit